MRGKGAIRSHEAVPVEAREREVARLEAIIKLTRLEAATLHNKAQLELQVGVGRRGTACQIKNLGSCDPLSHPTSSGTRCR